jgi:hypothetical protein
MYMQHRSHIHTARRHVRAPPHAPIGTARIGHRRARDRPPGVSGVSDASTPQTPGEARPRHPVRQQCATRGPPSVTARGRDGGGGRLAQYGWNWLAEKTGRSWSTCNPGDGREIWEGDMKGGDGGSRRERDETEMVGRWRKGEMEQDRYWSTLMVSELIEPRRWREMRGRCEGDAREMRGRCEGDAREMEAP